MGIFPREQTGTWGAWGLGNVLNLQGNLVVAEDTHRPDYQLKSIVYMQPDFNTYYRYDPVTDHAEPVPLSSYAGSYPSPVGSSSYPIIVSTSDGSYAFGLIAERSAQESLQQESHYYYLGYSDGSNYFRLNTMNDLQRTGFLLMPLVQPQVPVFAFDLF